MKTPSLIDFGNKSENAKQVKIITKINKAMSIFDNFFCIKNQIITPAIAMM